MLKPDGIGDFVLATGALRCLATAAGEERLLLAVLPAVAPLAAQQFPRAEILPLPLRGKRKVLNLFLANFLRLAPPWAGLLRRRFSAALSLRHSRNYLHSFLLATLRAPTLCLAENQLGRGGSKPRASVEKLLWTMRHARVVAYPESAPGLPREIAAHRAVLACFLQREISPEDILPRLQLPPTMTSTDPTAGHAETFFLCPFSTDPAKDFPAERWRELLADLLARKLLDPFDPWVLTGSQEQAARLQDLRQKLRSTGLAEVAVETSLPLPEFVRRLSSARAVFTVDTAAAHLATALDRPTLIAFSGLHRGSYAPWHRSPRQQWLEASLTETPPLPGKKKPWHQGISHARLLATACQVLAGHAHPV